LSLKATQFRPNKTIHDTRPPALRPPPRTSRNRHSGPPYRAAHPRRTAARRFGKESRRHRLAGGPQPTQQRQLPGGD